MGRGVTPPP